MRNPLAALVLLLASFATSAVADDVTRLARIEPASAGPASFVARFDRARRAAGLPRARMDEKLNAAAARHAADMRARGFFGHRGSDGSTVSVRVKGAGFRPCYSAENIARGQFSEAQIFDAWFNSPGHRRNMMNGRLTRYGVANAGGNWVMVLAQPC